MGKKEWNKINEKEDKRSILKRKNILEWTHYKEGMRKNDNKNNIHEREWMKNN